MINPANGRLTYYALIARDDDRDPDHPMVPGICTVCGALVAGWTVEIFHDDGIISPAYLHQEWHRERGELK